MSEAEIRERELRRDALRRGGGRAGGPVAAGGGGVPRPDAPLPRQDRAPGSRIRQLALVLRCL